MILLQSAVQIFYITLRVYRHIISRLFYFCKIMLKKEDLIGFITKLYILFIERKKALKYLVQGHGVRKNLSVIESYTRI